MQRIKELDSIRGLAALTIVFYHLWFQALSVLGTAVDLFFVLSGYLITTIILKHAPNERFLTSFYLRRGLRIWPIYYLTLLTLVIIYPYLPSCGNLQDLPYFLTFTQELSRYNATTEPTFPSAFRHTWTLAIEEQFYLIWPPLLWLFGRRRVSTIAISMVVLALVARAMNLSAFILITRCDGLALGGLLAGILDADWRTADRASRLRLRFAVLAVGSTVISAAAIMLPRLVDRIWPGAMPPLLVYIVKPLCLNLMFFALVGTIVLHAGDPRLRWLRDRRLVYLGSISYGVYLYHHFVFEICKYYEAYFRMDQSVALDILKVLMSIGAAALSWKYLERPILTLKDRFRYTSDAPSGRAVSGRISELGGAEAG